MKHILLSILILTVPTVVYAQESLENSVSTPTLTFWEILLAVLAPLTLFIIAYLLIKKFKL